MDRAIRRKLTAKHHRRIENIYKHVKGANLDRFNRPPSRYVVGIWWNSRSGRSEWKAEAARRRDFRRCRGELNGQSGT